MASLDDFDIAAVRAALVGTRFARGLEHFVSVGSTNELLREAAAAGAPEGTVYVADEQTAGRGRGGHSWHSAPGDGLYVSVLVRPPLRLGDALLLSLATGLDAQQAIREAAHIEVDIRWPNDLLVVDKNGSKKVGGILVETAVEPAVGSQTEVALRYAVIGIGINVNHKDFPAELAPLATSLRLASGREQSRAALLVALLRAIDRELALLEDATLPRERTLLERFAKSSSWALGKRVSVPEQGGYTGVTVGLDERGFLLVASDDSVIRTVLSGGVREADTPAG